jgi:hypothetical protein
MPADLPFHLSWLLISSCVFSGSDGTETELMNESNTLKCTMILVVYSPPPGCGHTSPEVQEHVGKARRFHPVWRAEVAALAEHFSSGMRDDLHEPLVLILHPRIAAATADRKHLLSDRHQVAADEAHLRQHVFESVRPGIPRRWRPQRRNRFARAHHRGRADGAWIDTGLVFTTRHGTALEPRNFSRSFDRCTTKAQVPRITVHGTRKTCGSLLAALDVHPRVAMQILRHSKIAVTMEIYTEVPSAATRDALKKLGQWLGS